MPPLGSMPELRHGLITTAAAYQAGHDRDDVRRRVRTGEWVRVRRGVYVPAHVWHSLDDRVGKPILRGRAAHLTLQVEHVLSHDTAALELGLPLIHVPERVHVTRPGLAVPCCREGIQHHGGAFRADEVTLVDGIPALGAARTAVDLARQHGYLAGLVACDRALRLGTPRAELEVAVEPMACWPGSRAARDAVRQADPRAETPGETLARDLVTELGFGRPWPQFPVRLPSGRVIWIDMVVGRQGYEFDGRLKYDDPGILGDKSAGQVVWSEKVREREVQELGLGISRIFWTDFWGPARGRALARLHSEYAVTARRFGTELPTDVLAFARQHAESWRRRL